MIGDDGQRENPTEGLALFEWRVQKFEELLPADYVYVIEKGIRSPFTRSLAMSWVRTALEKEWPMDTSNGEEPTDDWDGYLVIEKPEGLVFMETIHAKRNGAFPVS